MFEIFKKSLTKQWFISIRHKPLLELTDIESSNKQPYKDNDIKLSVRVDPHTRLFLNKLAAYKKITQKDFVGKLVYQEIKRNYFLIRNNAAYLELFEQERYKYQTRSEGLTIEEKIKEIRHVLEFATRYDLDFFNDLHNTIMDKYEKMLGFSRSIRKGENDTMNSFL